jgi:hypothetical protein
LVTVEEELRSLGYQIVAISPDRPEELNKMTKADHLNYRLFSDPQGDAMKKFGVAYQVDNTTLTNLKQKFNVDLERSSGQTHHILPVPSVFITTLPLTEAAPVSPSNRKIACASRRASSKGNDLSSPGSPDSSRIRFGSGRRSSSISATASN